MQLEFRDFAPRDLDTFATVVGRVFKDDTYTDNPELTRCLLRHELIDYLRHQNYAKVVVEGDKPVGILIAEVGEKKLRRPFLLEALDCHLRLLCHRAGRTYLRYRRGLRHTDMRLLTGQRYHAELRLFIVVEGYRNLGIGHKLLLDFQKACAQHRIKEYFLFTDSYCDVDYYKERGFHLVAERTYDFFRTDPPAKYYLFTKKLEGDE